MSKKTMQKFYYYVMLYFLQQSKHVKNMLPAHRKALNLMPNQDHFAIRRNLAGFYNLIILIFTLSSQRD